MSFACVLGTKYEKILYPLNRCKLAKLSQGQNSHNCHESAPSVQLRKIFFNTVKGTIDLPQRLISVITQ